MLVVWRVVWASSASSSRHWPASVPLLDFLTAPIAFDFTRSYVAKLSELDLGQLNDILRKLERDGRRIVEAAGVPASDITVRLNIDMRYVGQGYEVRAPFPMERLNETHVGQMQRAFEAE